MRDPDLTTDFMNAYKREKQNHRTLAKAYEATERKWAEENGRRFYKNYASFRASKCHWIKISGKLV